MSAPSWMSKHPCVACGSGYGFCAQFATRSLKCCDGCEHPTRWSAEPWTAADLVEMWQGQEMPENVRLEVARLRSVNLLDPFTPPVEGRA